MSISTFEIAKEHKSFDKKKGDLYWRCPCSLCRAHRCVICGALARDTVWKEKAFWGRTPHREIILHPAGSRVCGRHEGRARVNYKK